MSFSQNEIFLFSIICIIIIYIIWHYTYNDNDETFDETPKISSELCNLNNEGFICGVTCKAFGKDYYVNKNQGCSKPCICP